MSSEHEIDIEQDPGSGGDISEILESYRLHTDRMNMLLGRWLEAAQVVSDPQDVSILDSLRHMLKLTLDDTSHEKMLRIVSVSIASQFGTHENEG